MWNISKTDERRKEKVEQRKMEERIKISRESQEKSYEGKESKGLYPGLAEEVRSLPYATHNVCPISPSNVCPVSPVNRQPAQSIHEYPGSNIWHSGGNFSALQSETIPVNARWMGLQLMGQLKLTEDPKGLHILNTASQDEGPAPETTTGQEKGGAGMQRNWICIVSHEYPTSGACIKNRRKLWLSWGCKRGRRGPQILRKPHGCWSKESHDRIWSRKTPQRMEWKEEEGKNSQGTTSLTHM